MSGRERGRGRARAPNQIQSTTAASTFTPSSIPLQPQQSGPSKIIYGRPAGMSSSDSEDDDGFSYSGASGSKMQCSLQKVTPPSQLRSLIPGASTLQQSYSHGAYYFSSTAVDPSDPKSSSVISGPANWGRDNSMFDVRTGLSETNSGTLPALPARHPQNSNRRDSFPEIPHLEPSVYSIMATLNKSWNNGFPMNKDSCLAHASVALRNLFQTSANPYSAALYCMAHSSDFFALKQVTLAFQVLNEFKKWLRENGLAELEETHLKQNLQKAAFDIVTKQRNTTITKLVCEIFRLDHIRDSLVRPILSLCEAGNFKEACLIATYLAMQSKFEVHDFAIPLLLQDRELIVEEYLACSKEKQMELIAFLDSILDDRNNILIALNDYARSRNIKNVKAEKLQAKPFMKLVTRIVDKFKADHTHCPNFSRKKRSAALRHLVYRKFEENSTLNDACFDELCDSTVLEDPALQDELVHLLRARNALRLAARFALRHAIPVERVSSDVQRKMHELNPNVIPNVPEPVDDGEDWETELNDAKPPKSTEGPKGSALGGVILVVGTVLLIVVGYRRIYKSREDNGSALALTQDERHRAEAILPNVGSTSPAPVETPIILWKSQWANSPPISANPSSSLTPPTNDYLVAAADVFMDRDPSPPRPGTPEGFDATEDHEFLGSPVTPKPDYYYVSLPKHKIHYMDTPYGIESFLQHLMGAYMAQKMSDAGKSNFIVVSLDAEWKPMMFTKGAGVALIQIGLVDEVFLLDIVKLKAFLTEQKIPLTPLEDLRNQFFSNEKVVKIGYGIEGDVKMLADTCTQWENSKDYFKGFLDLSKVVKQLVKQKDTFFPYSTGPAVPSGLSDLVRAAFGKPLSKEEQFSNWEHRPLREAQIQYAANDAYVLLELFSFMNKRCHELNLDLHEIVLNALKAPQAGAELKPKKFDCVSLVHKVATTTRFVPDESPFKTTQLAQDLKVVCDNMLQGLGKHLRSCGIDTYILDNNEDHYKCVELAFRDNRVVLTRGTIYTQLTYQYPEVRIFNITTDKVEDQLHDLLSYFNISICEADLFSRCQKCNSGTFISVSQRMMEYLVHHRAPKLRQNNPSFDEFRKSEGRGILGEITYSAEDCSIGKKWNLLPENNVDTTDLRNACTSQGAPISFESITPAILERISNYIICDQCGKIYWDGSHLRRVLEGKSKIKVTKSTHTQPDATGTSPKSPRKNTSSTNSKPTSAGHASPKYGALSNPFESQSPARPYSSPLNPHTSTATPRTLSTGTPSSGVSPYRGLHKRSHNTRGRGAGGSHQ